MKKRIRRGDSQRWRHWEEVLRRWREGGQAVRAFCRAEGVQESAFYFWRRELARRDLRTAGDNPQAAGGNPGREKIVAAARRTSRAPVAASAARSASRKSARPGDSPFFLPVRVVGPDVSQAACGVEIVLTHGRVVRVGAGFDRQTLADVVAVLEARPC
jgi:transposase-like protein